MNKVKSSTEKQERWIAFGAIICGLYVILGAFGAHGLENKLNADQLQTYHTGLRYMIIHGLAMILINLSNYKLQKNNSAVNYLLVAGLVLFSLSLVIHACKSLLGIEINMFALFAPIGGLSFVAAWFLYAYTVLKK